MVPKNLSPPSNTQSPPGMVQPHRSPGRGLDVGGCRRRHPDRDRSTNIRARHRLGAASGGAPRRRLMVVGTAEANFSTAQSRAILFEHRARMTYEKQGKLKLIDGGAGEVRPPAAHQPMPKWQWTILWIGSIAIWLLLFYYFWLALR